RRDAQALVVVRVRRGEMTDPGALERLLEARHGRGVRRSAVHGPGAVVPAHELDAVAGLGADDADEREALARAGEGADQRARRAVAVGGGAAADHGGERSGEHTSELQSRAKLVCRLLLE